MHVIPPAVPSETWTTRQTLTVSKKKKKKKIINNFLTHHPPYRHHVSTKSLLTFSANFNFLKMPLTVLTYTTSWHNSPALTLVSPLRPLIIQSTLYTPRKGNHPHHHHPRAFHPLPPSSHPTTAPPPPTP